MFKRNVNTGLVVFWVKLKNRGYEDVYLVFQDMQHILMKFLTYTTAERYVRNKYYNPQIITIDFKKRLMVVIINLFHLIQ